MRNPACTGQANVRIDWAGGAGGGGETLCCVPKRCVTELQKKGTLNWTGFEDKLIYSHSNYFWPGCERKRL